MTKDIRLAVSYPNHPKIKRLKRRLGAEGVLAHIRLLMFAGEHRTSGELTGMDAEYIADATDFDGDPDELVKALLDVGLLECQGGQLVIHDWAEHNPYAAGAEERSERARNAARSRWDKRGEAAQACSTDADSMPDAMPNDATRMQPASLSNAPSPSPSPSPYPSLSPTAKKKTSTPQAFPLSDAIKAWAKKQHISIETAEEQVDPFLDHHRANNSKFADWDAAFRKWLRNSLTWGHIQPEGAPRLKVAL